jgi:N-acetylglucosamine repressor
MHAAKASKQQEAAEAQSALIREVRRRDASSRVQLARSLSLAPSTVGLYVDRLIGEGYLREGRKLLGGSGRPATIVELNPQAGEFIGVDFDARLIAATSVDFSQQVRKQTQRAVRASDTVPDVLARIEDAIGELARPSQLLGIGVAVPGAVDSNSGIARHYEHIPGWQDVPLVARLSRRFRVPIYLENNIRAFALAEQWFSQRAAARNFVCLGIRSGIGAGVVIDGKLHHGTDGLAGEIGSWPCVAPAGDETQRTVTLERVASVRAILDRLTDETGRGASTALRPVRGKATLDELLRAARASDPLVLRHLQIAAAAVGQVIAQLSLLLNPERVVIAGPLAELTEAFLDPVSQAVDQYLSPQHAKKPAIVASSFGDYGGALGAAALAVHQWRPR